MFRLDSLNPFSREAVALTIAFQRLGFELGKVSCGQDGAGLAFVALHHGTPGNEEQYIVNLGLLVDIPRERFVGEWREAVLSLANGEVDRLRLAELCHKSDTWRRMEALVLGLFRRGFISASDGLAFPDMRPQADDIMIDVKAGSVEKRGEEKRTDCVRCFPTCFPCDRPHDGCDLEKPHTCGR